MPHPSLPRRVPVGNLTDHPPQLIVTRPRLARNQAIFHFREMAFEKIDLMFKVDAGSIGVASGHTEMVVNLSCVYCSCSLREQLSATHGLAIPVRCRVDRHFNTLLGGRICGVLVRRREVDIFGDISRAMDIVLVWSDFSAPRPF